MQMEMQKYRKTLHTPITHIAHITHITYITYITYVHTYIHTYIHKYIYTYIRIRTYHHGIHVQQWRLYAGCGILYTAALTMSVRDNARVRGKEPA